VKRFESAAQAGQILVSESCQSLATGIVTFNALPPKRMEASVTRATVASMADAMGVAASITCLSKAAAG